MAYRIEFIKFENKESIAMVEEKEKKNEILEISMIALYFFIPFYGMRIVLENYLQVYSLGMAYTTLLGFVSAIVVIIYVGLLLKKR